MGELTFTDLGVIKKALEEVYTRAHDDVMAFIITPAEADEIRAKSKETYLKLFPNYHIGTGRLTKKNLAIG